MLISFCFLGSLFAGGNRFEIRLDTGFSLERDPYQVFSYSGRVYDVVVDRDGGVILGGLFDGGIFRWRIGDPTHYSGEYESDNDFDVGDGPGGATYNYVNSMLRLPNDDILAGGEWNTWDGLDYPNLIRLNPNGSIEELFDAGSGPNEMVRMIKPLDSGQILIAGTFTEYSDVSVPYICRIWPDGTLDESFEGGTSLSPLDTPEYTYISEIAVLDDGKIMVGGRFAVDGKGYANLARLNSDGTLDTSFETDVYFDYVEAIIELEDGSVLVGGSYGDVLVRLDDTGENLGLDSPIYAGSVYELEMITMGGFDYLLVAGEFRHESDGKLYFDRYCISGNRLIDLQEVTPISFDRWIGSIVTFPEGAVYLAGAFSETSVDGQTADVKFSKCIRFGLTDSFRTPDEDSRSLFFMNPLVEEVYEDQSPVHFGVQRGGDVSDFGNADLNVGGFGEDLDYEFEFEENEVFRMKAIPAKLKDSGYTDENVALELDALFDGSLFGDNSTVLSRLNIDRDLFTWLQEELESASDNPDDWVINGSFKGDGVSNETKALLGWTPSEGYQSREPRIRLMTISGNKYPVYSFYIMGDFDTETNWVRLLGFTDGNLAYPAVEKQVYEILGLDATIESGWVEFKGEALTESPMQFFRVGGR
ncbi:MAG: hypothetical protein ACPGN3_14460 [Opitutales bacterium]